MLNFIFALSTFISLLILLFSSVYLGHRYAYWQWQHNAKEKREVVSVAEGAVFALLGLLVAFTFTSAYERFEARKMYLIDEVNAIESVYLQTGLLTVKYQEPLVILLSQYLDSRLAIYKAIAETRSFTNELNTSFKIRHQLWKESLLACKQTANHASTILFIPAVIKMFDIADTRLAVTKVHPPFVIFILLIGLSMSSAFLAGYNMKEHRVMKSLHILAYIFIMAFTLYVIIDLELPRLGLIRMDWFDQILVEELARIKSSHH